MKKQFVFIISVLGILLLSCQPGKNTTTVLPAPSGTMGGFIALNDEFGNPLANSSGVTVTLDSTGYTTTTDNNGTYVFQNIPINRTYNFTFSKAGYPSWHIYDYVFTTEGTAPLMNVNNKAILNMYPQSSTVVNSVTATAVPNGGYGYINVTVSLSNTNPAYQSSFPIGAVVFFSTQKNVSPNNFESTPLIVSTATVSAPGTYTGTYPSSNLYGNGTALYFIAYGFSGTLNSTPASYMNLLTGQQVFPFVSKSYSVVDSVVTQ